MEQKYSNLLGLMGQESGIGPIPLPFKDVEKVYDSLYVEVSHSKVGFIHFEKVFTFR